MEDRLTLRILFIGLPVLILVLGIRLASQWKRQIARATGLALIGAGLISGIMVLLLDQRVIALGPEPRYIIGILLSGVVLLISLKHYDQPGRDHPAPPHLQLPTQPARPYTRTPMPPLNPSVTDLAPPSPS